MQLFALNGRFGFSLRHGILFAHAALGQIPLQQTLVIDSPAQLVGKKINVKRLPLCEPGTYKGDLEHAGMIATVVGTAPSTIPIPALSKSAPRSAFSYDEGHNLGSAEGVFANCPV